MSATSRSITELLSNQGRIAGNAERERAGIAAQAQRERGQIFGSTIAQIGQQIGNLPKEINQAKTLQLETQTKQMQFDLMKRAQVGQAQANQVIAQMPRNEDGTFDTAALIQGLSQKNVPLPMLEQLAKSFDGVNGVITSFNQSKDDHLADLANTILTNHQKGEPFTADAVHYGIAAARAAGLATQADEQKLTQALASGSEPEAVLKTVRGLGTKYHDLNKPITVPQGGIVTTQGAVQEAGGQISNPRPAPQPTPAGLALTAAGGDANAQKALGLLNADKTADNARADAGQTETIRHNKAMEGAAMVRARRPIAGSESSGGEALTPDAIERTATQARLLGNSVIPTRLSENSKNRILNAIARQDKVLGLTPAQSVTKQLMTKADSTSLNKLGVLSASAESFENKAVAQAGLIRDISAKVPRTKFPIINNAIQAGRERITGDEDATKLANAITTFSAEYAKIMEGSAGSVAGSSEGARKAATRLINTGMSQGTLAGVLDLMQQEMRLTIQGYDVAKEHITGRIGSGQAAPATVTPTMRYNPATGKVEPIK